MGYNYKDKYYDNQGNDIEYRFPGNVRFLTASKLSGGDGSRENPATSTLINFPASPALHCVLDGGYHHRVLFNHNGGSGSGEILSGFIGTSKNATKIKIIGSVTNGIGRYYTSIYFKDLELAGGNLHINRNTWGTGSRLLFTECIISSNINITGDLGGFSARQATNCIFKNEDIHFISSRSYISYLNAVTNGDFASLSAYEKCDITITQQVLTSYFSNYLSFDNCRFKFPNDTEFIELKGNTPEELRNDFIERCDAEGLTYDSFTEYDFDNVPLGRWLFTVDNSSEAIIYKDTDIYKFESARGFNFGFSATRPSKIAISNTVNLPNSINPNNPNSGNVRFNNGFISFSDSLDITQKNDFHITSNIIPLNRIRKIDEIICPNNLEWRYGFLLDAEKNLDLDNPILPGNALIESGVHYIVRSTDKNYATVIYNKSTYNTSLALPRTNIIIGIDGVNSFTAGEGNPILYKIVDNRQYQSVQMRIVNKIPGDIIKTGNLIANWWYLVEHDSDQSNTSDYITYNGIKYYAGASFLVKAGVLNFSVSGSIHLRRCWNESYNPDDAQDKAFWQSEQKPRWINVNPNDLYCLMKNNSGAESEMHIDGKGEYITSGHSDFYNMVLGSAGITVPKYPIKGAYLQLRIPMSTLNIM
ncbi:MAG: hypothetical protein ACK5KT_11435 [Dysgonomonas sp.]